MIRRSVLLAATAAVVGGLTAPVQAQELTKVNYMMPAPAFLPAFAPWQIAKQKGYYKEEGLEVTFQRSKGGVDVAKQVGVGNAPIGGGIGDTAILVRPNGIPVKAVALMGGGSLVQLVARADRGIEKVEDLKGRTMTVMSYQDTTFYASQGILAARGMTRKDVNIQAAGPQGVWKLFIEGKADAMMGVPDWIGIAYGRKVPIKIFNAQDYFPSMAQALLASDDLIRKNPKMIQGLVRATLRGLKDVMDNPDAAAEVFVKAVPRWKAPPMAATFKLYNKYTYPGQETLGAFDEKRLAALQDFYLKAGFIKKTSKLSDLYTNEFVK